MLHSIDVQFCLTDLGSSLVGEIKPRPPQHKIKLLPRLSALFFGMEMSMDLWTSAGVEKDLCWVEKCLSIDGCMQYIINGLQLI